MTPPSIQEALAYFASLPPEEKAAFDRQMFGEKDAARLSRWRANPVAYAEERLKVRLTDVQKDIIRAVVTPPGKVFIRSGHAIGKTFLLAVLVCWFFDCHDPSLCITTAPTDRDVCDVLWKEVRSIRQRAGLSMPFIGPSAPEMRTSPDHVAMGFTARLGGSFQGRHDLKMMIIFDEAVDISPLYWEGAASMFKPGEHYWICAMNPTSTASQAYIAERSGGWQVFGMSSLDHPNIAAEQRGEPPPVPAAVSMSMVDQWVLDWCRPITDAEKTNTDIQWRDPEVFARTGATELRWYRPSPSFQARALGQWPQEAGGVWWTALWDACTKGEPEKKMHVPVDAVPEIGCDVARSSGDGSDDTANHVRWGNTSFLHEWANGWRANHVIGRLIELANEFAARANKIREHYGVFTIKPTDIPIKVDDSNVGGAVVDLLQQQGYKVVPVSFGGSAYHKLKYPNRRSELWFSTSDKAHTASHGIWFGRLDPKAQRRIEEEMLAVQWQLNTAGQRVVEEKKVTKKKLGRSPDSADAVNLAYLDAYVWEAPIVLPEPEREMIRPRRDSEYSTRRNLFGRY